MKNLTQLIIFIALLGIICSCNLEQNIDLDLPGHEPKMVVECYLEPGNKVNLLLTESSGYFDPPKLPLILDAVVTISYDDVVDTFTVNTNLDQSKGKFYNYISKITIPYNYDTEFLLNIKDKKGREITGKTKLMKAVAIDTIEYKFNKDSLALILVSFFDDISTDNQYRFIVHKDSLSNVIQRFEFTDELSDSSKITLGTSYTFKKGQTALVTLYHIDLPYYDFLESIESSREANANPFAQPAMIKSNVQGGMGIFTSLASHFKTIRIGEQ